MTGWRRFTDAIGGIGVVVLVPTLLMLLVYIWLFVRSMVKQPTLPHLIILLDVWQTQTGAAFALAAALIGAIVIVRQTTATERREEERRERRAKALRAVLPVLLSELADYAARCADIFSEVLEAAPKQAVIDAPSGFQPAQFWPIDQHIPPLPSGFVGQLTDLIETIPSDHARPLVTLIKRVQIQHSKSLDLQQHILSPRQEHIVVRANLVTCLIDATEVFARCERLFPYARGEMSAPPGVVSADDVQRSAFLAVRSSLVDEVAAEIDRYAATRPSWPDVATPIAPHAPEGGQAS